MLRQLPRFMPKPNSIVRFLLIFNALFLTLLLLLLTLGNSIALHQEKSYLQARDDLIKFYISKLNQPPWKRSEAEKIIYREFQTIYGEFQEKCKDDQILMGIINQQFNISTNDESEKPIPACLRTALEAQSSNLDILVSHILNIPVTLLGSEFYKSNYLKEQEQPYLDTIERLLDQTSYIDYAKIQRLLLILGKQKLLSNQQRSALDTFAAVWKLNQSMVSYPVWLNSAFNTNSVDEQARFLRTLRRFPENWQKQFPEYDRRTPLFKGIELETMIYVERLRLYPLKEGYESSEKESSFLLLKLLQTFQQPYFTLSTVSFWQKAIEFNTKLLHLDDLCSIEEDQGALILKNSLPVWNAWHVHGRSSLDFNVFTWRKLGKSLLHWELTEKVLTLKEKLAETDRFPLPTSEISASSACPSQRWRYSIAPDGSTATIAIDQPPKPRWSSESELDPEPHWSSELTYTINRARVLEQK